MEFELLTYCVAAFTIFIAIAAFAISFSKNILSAIILSSLVSFLATLLYLFFDAPDVAMTEASVGACISTVFMLKLASRFNVKVENYNLLYKLFCMSVCIGLSVIMLISLHEAPAFGDPSSPVFNHVAPYYIKNTGEEIGIPSTVAAILASYRGFDTLGETIVVYTAGISVLLVMKRRKNEIRR